MCVWASDTHVCVKVHEEVCIGTSVGVCVGMYTVQVFGCAGYSM